MRQFVRQLGSCIRWMPVALAGVSFALHAAQITEEQRVGNLVRNWCDLINTVKGNSEPIVKLYAPNAIILPALSTKILVKEKTGIEEYYSELTKMPHISCEVRNVTSRIFKGAWAISDGNYKITYTDPKKENVKKEFESSFSIVYQKQPVGNDKEEWLIVHQHSAVLPDILSE